MEFFWFLIIGIVAGWLAGKISKGKGFGLLGNFVIGVIGAYIGGFLFAFLGLVTLGLLGTLIMATAGALVLLWLVQLIKRI